MTTKLAGLQHGGVLLGMIIVAIGASAIGGPRLGNLRNWIVGGCLAASTALVLVAAAGLIPSDPGPLRAAVFALGVGNGIYAASAIGAMISARGGRADGALGRRAQAVALGAGGVDRRGSGRLARWGLGSALDAYGAVFVIEAAAFVAAALLAVRIERAAPGRSREPWNSKTRRRALDT